MPSLLKKLIYGKELSNPYLNRYHPSHTSSGVPTSTPNPPYIYPPNPTPAAGLQPHSIPYTNYASHIPTSPHAYTTTSRTPALHSLDAYETQHSERRDFLAEARINLGRDPVTGRSVAAPREPRARLGESGSVNHARIFVRDSEPDRTPAMQMDNSSLSHSDAAADQRSASSRYEIVASTERRRRDEEETNARGRAVGGYFAPAGEGVREFYEGV